MNNIIHMPGLGVCKHDTIMVQIDVQPRVYNLQARSQGVPPIWQKVHF